MANEGFNHQAHSFASAESFTDENSTPVIPGSDLGLKHHQDISLYWTPEEQAIFEQGFIQFASEPLLSQYTKIAIQLKDKTVRDVALRVRWKNANGKRKKDDHSLTRKRKEKKEIIYDPSAESSHSALSSRSGTCYEAIAGRASELLEQNEQALSQIHANLAAFRVQDNINLFRQTRNNILQVMNELNEEPEEMKKLPPLPALRR